METLRNEFIVYLRYEKRRSERTIGSYLEGLKAFEAFVKGIDESLGWQTVDKDIIRNWIESLMDGGMMASSVNCRLSSLRSFYRFALSRGFVDHDPAHSVIGPKREKPLPYYLREGEMDKLLDSDSWTDDYQDVCERTIIMLFYQTGMRLSELIDLTLESVNFSNSEIKVLGKGNKERLIPFGRELREVLEKYLESRSSLANVFSNALLLNRQGRRLSKSVVGEIVKRRLSVVTTMKKRSPHVLRHTFATVMLNNESGIESVQKLLGHSKLSTTNIYTHTALEQLKKTYGKAHPRGDED